MRRPILSLLTLAAVACLVAWILAGAPPIGGGHLPDAVEGGAARARPGPDHPGVSLSSGGTEAARSEELRVALARIARAAEPFEVAAREAELLRSEVRGSLVWAYEAWRGGLWWAACAVIGTLRSAAAPTETWLVRAAAGENAPESAIAVLGLWFIHNDTERAVSGLVDLQARLGVERETGVREASLRMAQSGAPIVEVLIRRLDSAPSRATVAVVRSLGAMDGRAVPVFEELVARLAKRPRRPVFGSDEDAQLLEDLVEALTDLGDAGIESVVRLLRSPEREARNAAEDAILAAPRRFSVSRLLSQSVVSPPPDSVLRVLPHVAASEEDWTMILGTVSTSGADAKRTFLTAMWDVHQGGAKSGSHVEAAIRWAREDITLADDVYDALLRFAPDDRRTSALVGDVLANGVAQDQATMLRRIAASRSSLTEGVRAAVWGLVTSPVPTVRAAAIRVLSQNAELADADRLASMVRLGLHDENEEVFAAAVQAISDRGLALRSLVPSAAALAQGRPAETQIEVLLAIERAGATRDQVEALVRPAWSSAGPLRESRQLRERIVSFLEAYAHRGADVAKLADELAQTERLDESIRGKLRHLADSVQR